MKRKVVKQGDSTLMISLPSKWAKNFNINKGEELEVIDRENNLIISKNVDDIGKKRIVKVDISSWGPLINRLLLSYFLKGYDEVEIKYSDINQIKRFQKEIVGIELLGFEVIKQSFGLLVIKDLSGSESANFIEVFNRLLFMFDNMCMGLIDSLEKRQSLDVIETDKAVNRLSYYCLRLLNKKGYLEFNKTAQVYSIVTLIEETADLFKDLSKGKFKIMRDDINVLKDIRISINYFKELFIKFDRIISIKMANNYEKIKKGINHKSEIGSYLHAINGNIIRMNNELLIMNA
jgi:phosphate uptake regulator